MLGGEFLSEYGGGGVEVSVGGEGVKKKYKRCFWIRFFIIFQIKNNIRFLISHDFIYQKMKVSNFPKQSRMNSGPYIF